MRAEVKEQAEESFSASVVAGGRSRKGGRVRAAGAEEPGEAAVADRGEGWGNTPPPALTAEFLQWRPHRPAQAVTERLDSGS